MRSYILSIVLLFVIGLELKAQDVLDLQYCLQQAVESNIQIKQTENSLSLNEMQYLQKKFSFLPGISGSLSANKAFGRAVDNFTQQIAISPWTGSPNLSASLTLFRGFSKWNDLNKAKSDMIASQYSIEDLKNDLRINVALSFFQVMYAKDNLSVAQGRAKLLNQQLEKAEAQMEAGVKTMSDVYSVKSQLASEAVNLVNMQNNYDRNLLQLVLLLNLDPRKEYTLERPNLEKLLNDDEMRSVDAIFDFAKLNNPGMRQKELELLSAKYGYKSSRAVFYPTLSLSYGMGSFYSSNDRPVLDVVQNPNTGAFEAVYGPPRSLFNQMGGNFGQNMSISMSIPIFQNYSLRQSYNSARITSENAELSIESEQNDLYKSIFQAYQDVKAAKAQFLAAQEALTYLDESTKYAKSKHEAGLMDFYTFMEMVNNKTSAENDLIRSRLDYILKRKILELHQGKRLSF